MARSEARVSVNLWAPGSAFADRSIQAQWLYMLLVTQSATSLIGTLPLTLQRWTGRASGVSLDDLGHALVELEDHRFAAADSETGEVWVRPTAAPVGPKQWLRALTLAEDLESPRLRAIVAAWLGNPEPAPATTARNRVIAAIRLAVYECGGYACQRCGWTTPVPGGYDGSYALAEIGRRGEGSRLTVTVLELDHIYPESLGGRFEPDNLQALCGPCNARKGARV